MCLQKPLGSPELELPTLSPFTIAQGARGWAWNAGWRVGAWALEFRTVEHEPAQSSLSWWHLAFKSPRAKATYA